MPEDAEPIPERKPSSGENKRRPLTVPAGNNNNNNNNNNQPGKITRTGSSMGLVRTPAGCFAFSHKLKPTGYKKDGNVRMLGSDTSYKYFHEITSGIPALQKPHAKHSYRPKLLPYSPLALCNRLPIKFDNEPAKHVRYCAPRNTHTEFSRVPYERQYLTHYHCYFPKWDNLPVGFENEGIMGDFARRTRANQLR